MIYLIILKDYRTFFKIFLKHPGFCPHVARTISEKVTFLVKTGTFVKNLSFLAKPLIFWKNMIFQKIQKYCLLRRGLDPSR